MTQARNVSSAEHGDAARQRSYVLREKWEESWLAEQRHASAVVRYEDSAARTDSAAEFALPSPAPANDLKPRPPSSPPAIATTEHADPSHQAHATGDRAACVRAGMRALPIGGFAAQHVQIERQQSGRAAELPSTAAAGERKEWRMSAFWRREAETGVAVEGAVRLRDPASVDAVLKQLKEWLRGSGAYLRRVLVNGRVGWQADASGAAAHPAKRPAGRHTYI